MKSKLFFRVFIPLALGAALYVLLCPETFLSRGFYALSGLRPPEIACGGAALRLVRNHLTDILWAWALTCCASSRRRLIRIRASRSSSGAAKRP